MDIKTKLQEYLDEEDVLYINIYLNNGDGLYLFKPLELGTPNLDLEEDHLTITGVVNDNNRMNTYVPYDVVTYVNAGFGTEEETVVDAEGTPVVELDNEGVE